jgi:Uma2 family endonuclease
MAVQKKTNTYADYSAIQGLPENADKILELIDGEIVEKMPSFTPSRVASRFNYYIMQYLMDDEIGYVTVADGGYVLSDEHTFNPDVGYISKARLPKIPDREVLVAPDLAIEVKSPTDSKRAMRRKAEIYLAHGTRMVWLVFPDDKIVEVYVPDQDVETVGIDGTLNGGDVLPGFTLPVKNIFPE